MTEVVNPREQTAAARSAPSRVFAALCESGPVPRSQLRRSLGTSLTTISDAISVLAEHGLVTETGSVEATGGRPATLLDVPAQVGGVLAADVGGSQLRVCAADLRGHLLDSVEVPTPPNPGELQETMGSALVSMRERLAGEVLATCVAVAGIVHPETQTISMTSNVPGWSASSIPDWLEKLDAPLLIENEANAGVFGEARFGAAAGGRDVLFVSLGAGIGSGMLHKGQVVHGVTGAAGEMGLMVGCWSEEPVALERVASGVSLLRRYTEMGGTVASRPADLFELAENGDEAARSTLDVGLGALSIALTNAILMTDPELVVLGGGLATAGALLPQALRARLRTLMSTEPPPVVIGALGVRAALRGAASLAARAAVGRLVRRIDSKAFHGRG